MHKAVWPARALSHQLSPSSTIISRVQYSARASSEKQTVQTPVQTQNKDIVAHSRLQPADSAGAVQTPIQSQHPRTLTPTPKTASRKRESNTGPVTTFWVLMIVSPPILYYWYLHRKEHMDGKKAELMKRAAKRWEKQPDT